MPVIELPVPQNHADLAAYLASVGCFDIVPVTLTVGKEQRIGCRYRQTTKLDPSCRAYQEGQRESTNETIYVIGDRFRATHRRSKTLFQVEGDDREWFVASHQGEGQKPHFLISPWQVPSGEKIDQLDRFSYTRVPLDLRAVEPVEA